MNSSSRSVQCVVLLHGLARTHRSMIPLQQALAAEGFKVVNFAYPSRHFGIADLARQVIPDALQACRAQGAQTIHFVTHSLGGIVLRYYCHEQRIDDLGRVVMLGPPNQGSEAVDRLRDLPGFFLLNGPAGLQLGTGQHDLPRKLGAVDFELGVIAGTRSINPFLSWLIPGVDDGKVSVASARAEGMTDFITLPSSHSFMMRNPQAIRHTIAFLKTGKFMR